MWCFWSAKGGVGTTVVATAVALASADSRSTLLVDLAGDVELLFGRAPARTGLGQWLDAENPPPDALSRLEIDLAPNLSLLPWGQESGDGRLEEAAGRTEDGGNESAPPVTEAVAGPVTRPSAEPGTEDRVALLARLVEVDDRMVIVDLGTRSSAPTPSATRLVNCCCLPLARPWSPGPATWRSEPLSRGLDRTRLSWSPGRDEHCGRPMFRRPSGRPW